MKTRKIEQFISPLGNDMFSNLKGMDLQDLIICIEGFYLTYRESLGLPEEVSFGTEIEYEDVFPTLVSLYAKKFLKKWDNGTDGSLSVISGEIVSPIMHDNKESWNELKRICHFLKAFNADTFRKAGGHVHVGAHILGKDIEAWKTFLKLYACYENVLYRFGFGDKATPRKSLEYYAGFIANSILHMLDHLEFLDEAKTSDEKIELFIENLAHYERYNGINFDNLLINNIEERYGKNTLEFRFPNATIEEVVWQNNINTFAKMMLACRNKMVDSDFLEYCVQHFEASLVKLSYYREVDLKKALEFVDLVFDKNIDKVYFLRQYFKSFYTSAELDKTVKAKRFIR